MGYVPENTAYLYAINLMANENYNADKQWFSSEAEMRQYLAGFRAAYADDVNNVISGEDGANLGMWYHMLLTTSANTQKEPVSYTGCDLPPLTDDEQTQLNDLIDEVEDMGEDWNVEDNVDTGLTDADKRYLDDYEQAEREQAEHNRFVADAGGPSNLGDGIDYDDAYDASLTEDERMAQAGMSDEDIAGVHFIEELNAQLDEARTCVGELLVRLDDALGVEMHWYGWTPSWYVEAAAVACGIKLEPTSDMCSRCGSCVCMGDCYGLEAEDLGGLPTVEIKLADTTLGKLAADWRFAEMGKARAADECRWQDGVSLTTPAGLRLSAKAAFMAGLDEDLAEAKKRLDDLPF